MKARVITQEEILEHLRFTLLKIGAIKPKKESYSLFRFPFKVIEIKTL